MLDAMVNLARSRTAHQRPSRLKAFRTYLIIFLVLILLLFSFSLISLVHQQDTVRDLSFTNLRDKGERIALDLENTILSQAEACLKSPRLQELDLNRLDRASLSGIRQLRDDFESLSKENPIADHFFVLQGSGLTFPRLNFSGSQSLESLVAGDRTVVAREFLSLIQEAEHERSGSVERARKAVDLYRQAGELDVPDRWKAIASYRAAQAAQKAGGLNFALPLYQELVKRYGDQYDESQVPYGISLALASREIAGLVFASYEQTLDGIYRGLIDGRWELSSEQVDTLLSQLEGRLGKDPDLRPPSHFLDDLAFAKAASAEFISRPARHSPEVESRAFQRGEMAYQTYYATLPEKRGGEVIVGFCLSPSWVQDELLAQSVVEIDQSKRVKALFEKIAAADELEEQPEDVRIPFETTLPFWRLHIPSDTLQESEVAARREMIFMGLSSGMFLCILGLGVFLLIGVSRDIHWYELQSAFVSGVSHELKTPLSLIRLYSETLVDDEQSYPPAERRSYLRIIARESERLSRLIDNILDFSRIGEGGKRYELQPDDLAEVVKQTVEDYSEYLTLQGFTIRTGIQTFLPPVRFNREQISQLVLNLLDNAKKYSGKSRLIRVHLWRENNDAVLEIQDYGYGIPAGEREKIFQPFYRVSRGGEEGGCGLGLYLVLKICEDHGGRIEIHSEIDRGTRIRFILPIDPTIGEDAAEIRKYDPANSVLGTR